MVVYTWTPPKFRVGQRVNFVFCRRRGRDIRRYGTIIRIETNYHEDGSHWHLYTIRAEGKMAQRGGIEEDMIPVPAF
jgi:hypothetical protein